MTFGETLEDRRQQHVRLAIATLALPKPRQ
jgi:hypothetical protein